MDIKIIIENLRNELVESIFTYGYNHIKTITKSQELDEYIVKSYKS